MSAPSNKILYFAPYFRPASSAAAAMRCTYLYRALIENQISSHVWSTNQTIETTKLLLPLASNRSSFLIRFVCEVFLGFEISLRLFFNKFSKSTPQFVLLSSPPYLTCWIAAFACLSLNIRYILDIRDPYPEVYFSQNLFKRNSLIGRIQIALAQFFYKNSNHIFTVTEACKDTIASYLKSSAPITVVRNGYTEEEFISTETKRSSFTCIFHGNLGLMQNISLLKNTIERCYQLAPEISFVVAGTGPQADLLSGIKTPNFEFLGELDHNAVIQLIKSCHLGLSFRIEDDYSQLAFPVKVYEYIGAELPTLQAPESKAMIELSTSGMAIMLSGENLDELVVKIIELARSKEVYSKYVENIKVKKQQYSRHYSAKVFIKKIKILLTY